MKKNIETKDIDWKEEHHKLAEYNKMLEEALEQEREENKKCKCSDKYNEIIKRLDIIGDMVGYYIKQQEKQKAKEQMERVKDEYEARRFEYDCLDMQYINRYQDELRRCCQCEER